MKKHECIFTVTIPNTVEQIHSPDKQYDDISCLTFSPFCPSLTCDIYTKCLTERGQKQTSPKNS